MNPKVSIIMLNWNGWEDTVECLESLFKIEYDNYDLVLVDNASSNGSIEKIKEYCNGKLEVKSEYFDYSRDNKPLNVAEYFEEDLNRVSKDEIGELSSKGSLFLIKNHKNYGFAEGNNIALQFAKEKLDPDYFLLLNNDTVVHKDFLREMVKVAKISNKIGAVGPKIYYYDYKGRKDVINFAGQKVNLYTSSGKRYGMNEVDVGQWDSIGKTDYIEGSCLLVKKEVIQDVGMLDVKYFAYWEETDFCMRIRNSGYILFYVPASKIWHKVPVTAPSKIKAYYLTRNRFMFMKKHARPVEYSIFLMVFALKFTYLSLDLMYNGGMDVYLSFLKGIKDGLIFNQAYGSFNTD